MLPFLLLLLLAEPPLVLPLLLLLVLPFALPAPLSLCALLLEGGPSNIPSFAGALALSGGTAFFFLARPSSWRTALSFIPLLWSVCTRSCTRANSLLDLSGGTAFFTGTLLPHGGDASSPLKLALSGGALLP